MQMQSIVFPDSTENKKAELYYRSNQKITVRDRKNASLKAGTTISFDTYFNALSKGKWIKYGDIGNVEFRFRLKGRCLISVIEKNYIDGSWQDQVLGEWEEYCTKEEQKISSWDLSNASGILYIKMKIKEDSDIGDMTFCSESGEGNSVKIAAVICTFHREAFIKKNVEVLKKELLLNEKSMVHGQIDVYIVDNGNSLSTYDIETENIFVFSNVNTGGSGGFTRGIIEVLKRRDKGYTHILLMDDDIVIEPEAIERTYSLLRHLNDRYRESFVGGAMLRLDHPNVIQESGAVWNGDAKALNKGLDVSLAQNVSLLDQEENADYNAWWYCCFPVETVNLSNLPLPFFIHGDDIEFGLRNCRNLILMNGIGVWHEVFEGKRSSVLEYYDIRNYLIINGIYRKDIPFLKIASIIGKRAVSNIMRLRYKDAMLNVCGIEDYLKGPEYWEKLDIVEKHSEIMGKGYKSQDAGDLKQYLRLRRDFVPGKWNSILSAVTFNGAFLPKIKKTVIVSNVNRICTFFRIGKACYLEPDGKKGVFVEFSFTELMKTYMALIGTLLKLGFHYRKYSRDYERKTIEMRTENYWNRYIRG